MSEPGYALDLGLFVEEQGTLKPANPICRETIERYMTRGTQDAILLCLPEVPWTTPILLRRRREENRE